MTSRTLAPEREQPGWGGGSQLTEQSWHLPERMADLARELGSRSGTGQTLQHVVEAAVELVGPCESAGISLAARRGQISTSASSDDLPTRCDELQQELGEGPCVDAAWERRVVSVPDLGSEQRWPRWATRAREDLGIGSMLCLQLFTDEDQMGALNLFSTDVGAFDEDDEHEAVAIAAHAAVAVAAAENIDSLRSAIDNRTIIGQATGISMVRFGLSDDQAFNLLRRLSNEQNRKLSQIAREIVTDWNASGQR